jgi:two-component system, NarL family, response regulator DesR
VKIVLADDSVLILEALREMLEVYSQAEIIASCKNGTDALEAIRTLKPDLAIVDIKMPGITGIKVLCEIRKASQATRFIILTLYSSYYYREQAMEAGADFFFSKQFDFEKIAGVVEGMLNKERSENCLKTANN